MSTNVEFYSKDPHIETLDMDPSTLVIRSKYDYVLKRGDILLEVPYSLDFQHNGNLMHHITVPKHLGISVGYQIVGGMLTLRISSQGTDVKIYKGEVFAYLEFLCSSNKKVVLIRQKRIDWGYFASLIATAFFFWMVKKLFFSDSPKHKQLRGIKIKIK